LSTPPKINNPAAKTLKVLVAPLDWGLGHATRCIPIIKELLNQKCQVIVAAEGAQKALLREEFPFLTFVELPGYRVQYDKNRALTVLRLIASIPKILIRIKRENGWLRRFADRERPDLVISDNRYGLYLPGTVTIFITHQLSIRTPFGKVADRLLQRINYSAIARFSVCWVPDVAGIACCEPTAANGGDGLAGELSHPKRMPPIPTRYIGWLSRMEVMPAPSIKDFDVLVLLSGPEPQRTILEKMIIEQAAGCYCKMVVVRGLPGGSGKSLEAPRGVVVYDHLPAGELERLMLRSDVVLSRPGYSTVMDLRRVGKRAIFVPTPGQTEQEYLGVYLAGKGLGICVQQHVFSLKAALMQAREIRDRPGAGNETMKDEIRTMLAMADGRGQRP
jgi:predicted glycosyltransferase